MKSADPKSQWDDVYREASEERIRWEFERPSEEFVHFIEGDTVKPPQRVLDLGCGLGITTVYLAGLGFEVWGIDISPAAIEWAKKRALEAEVKANFREGNVLDLPYPDRSFDLLYDRGCFHFLPRREWRRYVDQAERVIRIRGRFVLEAYQHRISPFEIHRVFGRHFKVLRIESTSLAERAGGKERLLWTAFMEKR